MKEFYYLPYRQTQGFVASIFDSKDPSLSVPNYTTLSRRTGKLEVSIRNKYLIKKSKEAIVVAVDSTGLSIYSRSEWNRIKHGKDSKLTATQKWRKLHVAINTKSGEILDCRYTKAAVSDGLELPAMLDNIPEDISGVCGDMAYDTINCRRAIKLRNARQLIPPIKLARLSKDSKENKKYYDILEERDEAIKYIKHNSINGNQSLARKSWKEKIGYHARSLVESTMWQIKSHCSDGLSNKLESTRATQAKIKCKVINLIMAA
jgi:hypothetical protein